jgi:histidinol-phosphate aminotransferase
MGSKDSNQKSMLGISRRRFLGAAAGSTAIALLKPSIALSENGTGQFLNDYVNRLCYNENPLGPSSKAVRAMQSSIKMGHRYSDWFAESLRGDLASLYDLSSSNIIAGCGATEILRLCAFAFADPDGNVVCPYPSYGQFASDANFLGASVRYSPLDEDYRIDLDDMASRVDSNTSAVCITNANNPTGTVLAADDIENFVGNLPSHVVVIIDEAYHEYIDDPSYDTAIQLVHQGQNVVVIRTFSKVFGLAGIRIGYAVGINNLISAVRSWQFYATVSRLALEAAKAAIWDNNHITNTVALNNEAKQYCFDNLDLMGLEYIPSQTNFFMVDVGQPAGSVASQLAQRGISVRTGWGMPNHLRVSTGRMEEMQDFISALNEILNPLRKFVPVNPEVTALGGNYPNPFNSSTQIEYSIAKGGHVLLQIFNIQGQLVKTVVDEYKFPGNYAFAWNGKNRSGVPVASGSYFYRLTAGDFSQTRRMILVK